MFMRRPRRAGTEKKHGNIHTTVDGITFDSKREAARYKHLLLAAETGAIRDIKIQPTFTLQEKCTFIDAKARADKLKAGKKYKPSVLRPITYTPDFQYTVVNTIDLVCGRYTIRLEAGEEVIEDVKGFKTETYKVKRKLFLAKYPNFIFIET